MKKIALTATMVAALGLAACEGANKGNNSADANHSGNSYETNSVGEAGAAAGNGATALENGLESAGNLAAKAGDAIENGASTAANKAESVVRDIGDGPDQAPANKTGR